MTRRLPCLKNFLQGLPIEDPEDVAVFGKDLSTGDVAKILDVSYHAAINMVEKMPGFYRVHKERRVTPAGLAEYMKHNGLPLSRPRDFIPLPHIAFLGSAAEADQLNVHFPQSLDDTNMVQATNNLVTLGRMLTRDQCLALVVSAHTTSHIPYDPEQIPALVDDDMVKENKKKQVPAVLLMNSVNGEPSNGAYEAYIPARETPEEQIEDAAGRLRELLHWKIAPTGKVA